MSEACLLKVLRVVDGDCDLRTDLSEQLRVVFGEGRFTQAGQRHAADNLVVTYQRHGATGLYAAGVGMLHDVSRELIEIGPVAQNCFTGRKRQGGGRAYQGNQLTLPEKCRVVREIESMEA